MLKSIENVEDLFELANPSKIKTAKPFMKECEEGEAELLISDALDWHAINTKVEQKKEIRKIINTKKIDQELFPPCIKLIMNGLLVTAPVGCNKIIS